MSRSIRTDIENNGKVNNLSRTNPILSTNIKLIVTDDDMYLESIDSSSLLMSSNYKKYLVKESGSYSYDLSKFWRLNSTPLDLAFKVKREYSDFSVLDSYNKQFEESYSYGTSVNYSKIYDYSYRMFAPIWLDKNIPKKFLIYRVLDPVDPVSLNSVDRINNILSKSTLIKTVDLSIKSKVGKYLRNYVADENFPKSPITVSFNKDEKVFYNGVDLEKGGFVSRGEFQYKDTLDIDKPLIEYNEFISNGFKRNSMVCANLINLEFLFNDETAEEFSINRYFGIYVDDHSIGSGIVDDIKNDLITFSEVSHNLDLNGSDAYFSIPNSDFYKKSPMLGWVKNSVNYHNVKNGADWDYSKMQLKIDSNNKDLNNFLGIKKTNKNIEIFKNEEGVGDYLKLNLVANPLNGDEFGIYSLKKQRFIISIVTNISGSSIIIEDENGSQTSVNSGATEKETLENIINNWNFSKYSLELESNKSGKYQIQLIEKEYNFDNRHSFSFIQTANASIVKIERTFTPMEINENTFICDNSIDKGKFIDNRFSGNGTLENVSNSICEAIENKTRFLTEQDGSIIYLRTPIKGYNRNKEVFLYKKNSSRFLEINENEDVLNSLNISSYVLSLNKAYLLKGGSNKNESVYTKPDDFNQVNIGEYLLNNDGSFNKIIDKYEEFNMLILQDKNKNLEGVINLYSDFRLEWGMFSAYDIYDFNFDFYDTSNSNLKELLLEDIEYVNTWPNSNVEGDPDEGKKAAYENIEAIQESAESYFANLIPILNDETTEEREVEKIYNEYDRLQENYTTQFATLSRIIPTINKWCLKDSKNVRENPYYLNCDESFGETNFSPSMDVNGTDKDKMTHEWFYLDKLPTYFDQKNINSAFSYVNPLENVGFNLNLLKDINFDYFQSYFLSKGYMTSAGVFAKTKPLKKYTLIDGGNSQSFSSTIFKGLKFTPKLRKRIGNNITKEFVKTSEFNGYKFSTCLKTNFNNAIPNYLKVHVIENKTFKNITLVLEINISDDSYDYLNRKLLYELDHKTKNGVFSDSILSGSLDLNSADLQIGGFTTVKGVPAANGSIPQFTTQILKDPNTGSYGSINITIGELTYELAVSSVNNDSELLISGGMMIEGVNQPTSYYSENDYKLASYGYKNGGIFAHRELLNQLNPSKINEILKGSNVEYITVELDGSITNNRLILDIEDGVELVKTSSLYPEIDINKPKSFKLSNEVIGYDIQERSKYFAFLTRHNGNYTVDMNPIITFSEPFSMHKIKTDWTNEAYSSLYYNYDTSSIDLNNLTAALYKKLNNCGVLFNVGEIKDRSHDESWGIIKNHFFHKVNEIDTEGVIKLSTTDDLLPKYQLINEIAIDKKDKNVFKSRWENDYYVRSLNGGEINLQPGTKNIIEEKSYGASSVIKTGDSYDLFNFTTNLFNNIEELNDIKSSNNTSYDINFIETETEVIMDFYLIRNFIKFLDNKGVRKTISKYVNVENSFGRIDTLDDDIEGYISENIIKLYTVSLIDLYVLESKNINTNVSSVESSSIISSGGYVLDNNYSFKKDPKNPLNFRLIYNKRLGFSYEIRPLVKIKT